MIKKLIENWKTTSAGASMVIGSTVHLVYAVKSGTANENTWTISLTAILGGIGLIFAGDANSSVSKTDAHTTFVTKNEVNPPTTTGSTGA